MHEKKRLIMLPGPTNIPDNVMRAMLKPVINHRGSEFRELHERITKNLKLVFETNQDVYVLTASGTGGVECAISNIVNPGDKIILPVFGFFSERVKDTIIQHGGIPVEIPVSWGDAPTAAQIEAVVKKERTAKALVVVYNETSTGVTVRDMPEMGKIAEENGLLFLADAISILGGDNLPVDKWNVDICVTASQKCLVTPPGLAMISVSKKAWEKIEKTTSRSYYFDLVKMREFYSKRETPFTPALPLFYALDEALEMILDEGLEKRYTRHATCARAFYAGLEALNLKPYAIEKVRSNTVISASLPEKVDGSKLREVMRERYNVVIGGGMGKITQLIIRIGCMGIISEAETLTTLAALENTLNDLYYPFPIGAGVNASRQVFKS